MLENLNEYKTITEVMLLLANLHFFFPFLPFLPFFTTGKGFFKSIEAIEG